MTLREKFVWSVILIFSVAFMALLAYATVLEHGACRKAGGRMVTKTVSGIGVSSGGSVVPTVSSVSFCLSEDGRILN